ncbi:MAG: hypothetical protein ACP5IE_09720 [Infirmifilum sp.]
MNVFTYPLGLKNVLALQGMPASISVDTSALYGWYPSSKAILVTQLARFGVEITRLPPLLRTLRASRSM